MDIVHCFRTFQRTLKDLFQWSRGNPDSLSSLPVREPLHCAPHLIMQRQLKVLAVLRRMPGASSTEIREAAGIEYLCPAIATRDLNDWIGRGCARKTGSNRWTRYYAKT